MNRIYLLLCIISLTFLSGLSQRILTGSEADKYFSNASLIRLKSDNPIPQHIIFNTPVDAIHTPTILKKLTKDKDASDWKMMKQQTDMLGMHHITFQQYFHHIPVEFAMYHIHIGSDGKIVSMNGEAYATDITNTNPTISKDFAIQRALMYVGAQQYKWEIETEENLLRQETMNPQATYYPAPQLVIVAKDANYENQPRFRLAWKMDIYAHQPMQRQWLYIDAENGEVLVSLNRIHTADVPGTAQTVYSGARNIVADFTGSIYRLRETGRGNGIETYNMNQGTNYGSAVDFTDSDNNWNNVNAQLDQYAGDAHWGAEMSYDYFFLTFSRNSIDNNGFKLRSYVHYDVNYNNAYWDGQRMTYGDGNGTTFYPLTSIDITGHEITHGLTEYTAGLIYQNESGALNESFSDIFGVCVDYFARGGNLNQNPIWRIGEEATPSGNGIRSMNNPNLFSDPDTYTGTHWYTGTADNGGVHTNSGVQNYWFYLLVMGGSGTNDLSNSFNVTGQGFGIASAVAYRNLSVYLTPNSNYADARYYAIQSAIDLYGPCTPQVEAVTNAWYAVGVGMPYSPTVAAGFSTPSTLFCAAPVSVQFYNQSTNAGSFLWNFGDGNTSTSINPNHIYMNPGAYNVKLVANGGACGLDSIIQTQYIIIHDSIPCAITLNPTGASQTQTSCSGTLYDSGGLNGNYQDNSNAVITIAPNGASYITLQFTQFGFEQDYDYLYIYDGPDITSPLIGQYSGTSLPNGGTIVSSGGSITLRQYSDVSVTDQGFICHWQCTLPTTPPSPDFNATALTSCNGFVQFIDLTTQGANTWLWDFGDGNQANIQNPSHTYLNDGVYDVTLTVTNNIGSNTIIKPAYITIDRPDAPIVFNQGACDSSSFTLNASATGLINWYYQLSDNNPFHSGSSFTTPLLNNSTTYYVEQVVSAPLQYVGPVNSSFGSGGMHNNTSTQYLTFTVNKPLTLLSVWVNSGSAGNRTVTLWDNAGNIIDTRYVYIPSGQSRISLNFDLLPGTNYRLGGSEMNLYRNNTGPTYPYAIAGLISITGSSAGSQYYYYFYDWEIQEEDCVSPRVPIEAIIGNIIAGFTTNINGLQVDFYSTATNATSWIWDGPSFSSTVQNPTHTFPTWGTYNIRHIANGIGCTDTIYSDIILFESGIDGNATATTSVSIYPNPSTDKVYVNISLSQQNNLDFEITDALGRVVRRWHIEKSVTDWMQIPIDIQSFASGMYWLNIYQLKQKLGVWKIVKQ
ncbi:MAG: M4 family metallopeptidase [Candidatus Competibacteraceae bacterium]|nr:M4 family metallopeptidase [Candidatus Competibacteraceae bacterium]